MKLGLKIIGALILVVAVALTSASWLIDRNTGRTYRSYLDAARQRQQSQLADQVAALRAGGEDWETIQGWLNDLPTLAPIAMPMHESPGMGPMGGMMRGRHAQGTPSPQQQLTYVLVDPENGRPLAESGMGTPSTQELPADQLAGSVPIVVNGATVARLALRQPVSLLGQAEEAVLQRTQEAILVAAALAGAVALVLGALLVWTLLRPLTALHAGVQRIIQGNLDVQVDVDSRDELGQLARGFNTMTAQLNRQETLRRQLIADIAHELRTPLSIIQGNLQAMLDEVYPLTLDEIANVHRESLLLSRLINDLHELAQAEAGALPLERQSLNVSDVLQYMGNLFRPLAASREIGLRIQPPSAAVAVHADPDRLQQILYNLLGNALRHTPRGGSVHLAAGQMGELVRFTVRDTGPGIPPEHLAYVFERFYRIDKSRHRQENISETPAGAPAGGDAVSAGESSGAESAAPSNGPASSTEYTAGAGLGLAIVRALAEAHGGAAGADSQTGEGATFWVDLPLSNQTVANQTADGIGPSTGKAG